MRQIKYKLVVLLSLVATFVGFCYFSCDLFSSEKLLGHDIRLFRDTPAWALAKAVEKEDTHAIRRLIEKKNMPIDFQEPKFGETLLQWATYCGKEHSVKILLELGADPNLQDFYRGDNAIMIASSASFYAEDWCQSNSLKLMLKYGGDPNSVQQADEPKKRGGEQTPLTKASSVCLDKVKTLVEAGADINYVSTNGIENPLRIALSWEKIDIVEYLLMEVNVNFHNAEKMKTFIEKKYITIVSYLRNWTYPIDSKEYKQKMRIVEFMKLHGENYWEEPIPKDIQKNYPKEYLEKY